MIVPAGTQAVVEMSDNSSWDTYFEGSESSFIGVFIKDRTVRLSPFIMGQYEVTQELYKAVAGTYTNYYNSSPASEETQKLRPAEQMNWYKAVAFCNILTEIIGIRNSASRIDYAYYTDDKCIVPYLDTTKTDIYYKKDSKGYRLPTEAEWEFAARGGDATAEAWQYAFAGVQTASTDKTKFVTDHNTDGNLANYGWYIRNSESKTHEVGLKPANTLGLYDVSGNVCEWCWDWYGTIAKEDVTDPVGPDSPSYGRVYRGGCCTYFPPTCAVSTRYAVAPSTPKKEIGFRVCRSL